MDQNIHPGKVRVFATLTVAGIRDSRLSGLDVLGFLYSA